MNISRSTYYHKSKSKDISDDALTSIIEEIVEEFSGYGYRRVTLELGRRGIPVNHKKILRIMRKQGLLCKPKRRYVRTTDSNHSFHVYPNLLEERTVTDINQVWVADITYSTHYLWLRIPGGHSGPLFQKGHRLCRIQKHRHGLNHQRITYGN